MQFGQARKIRFTGEHNGMLRPNLTSRRSEPRSTPTAEVLHFCLLIDDPTTPFNSSRQSPDQTAGMNAGVLFREQRPADICDAHVFLRPFGAQEFVLLMQSQAEICLKS